MRPSTQPSRNSTNPTAALCVSEKCSGRGSPVHRRGIRKASPQPLSKPPLPRPSPQGPPEGLPSPILRCLSRWREAALHFAASRSGELPRRAGGAAIAAGETGRQRGGAAGVEMRKCRLFCLSVRGVLSWHLAPRICSPSDAGNCRRRDFHPTRFAALPAAPVRRYHPSSCAGCPGRALPSSASLRAAAAGSRWVLEPPPSPPPARRARRGAGRKCRVYFLLCCRCCQAPLKIFFPAFFRRCVTSPRSVWRLPGALGPLVANDLLSVRAQPPVTRFSLRRATRAGRPVGGDPISPTVFGKTRKYNGPPPPAPGPRPHAAPTHRLCRFEFRSLW